MVQLAEREGATGSLPLETERQIIDAFHRHLFSMHTWLRKEDS